MNSSDRLNRKFVFDSHAGTGRSRLLILCQLFYPELVSTGQTLTELAEQLAIAGVDVEVVCGPPTILGRREKVPKRMEHRGIHIRRVWGTRFPKLSLVGRIINQISFTCSAFLYLLLHRPRQPVLVLTNPPFLAMSCAFLRIVGLGAPYLYLIFDVYPDTAVHLGLLREKSLLARLWDYMNVVVCRHASAVVVIGRCMKDVVTRKLSQGGLELDGKLQYIPVWCDDTAITAVAPDGNDIAQRFGVEGKFVVGYFGNMGRFHDIETIMGAAELLRDDPDTVFLFVGEGHKKKWAMQYALQHGLDNCRFHGYVDREDLGHLLALADLGLVSLLEGQEGLSVPSKTFGLMAAGVPVLAIMSATGEIARMTQEEDCGIQIQPGEAQKLAKHIWQLHHHPEEMRAMGANGRRAIKDRYGLQHVCRRYVTLIDKLSRGTELAEQPMPEAAVPSEAGAPNQGISIAELHASSTHRSATSELSGATEKSAKSDTTSHG
jgi:glycosyltransferase involved in cell wall biosynthesis